jgi:RNase P subunit RPR2
MWLTCPECKERFYFKIELLVMLKESFKLNPKLQIICQKCGLKRINKG